MIKRLEEYVFGVKAVVFLKFDGELNQLVSKLNSCFDIELYLDNEPEAPYKDYATCQMMGFEVFLEKSNEFNEFCYVLELGTVDLLSTRNDKMYDFSAWLSDFLRVYNIETKLR